MVIDDNYPSTEKQSKSARRTYGWSAITRLRMTRPSIASGYSNAPRNHRLRLTPGVDAVVPPRLRPLPVFLATFVGWVNEDLQGADRLLLDGSLSVLGREGCGELGIRCNRILGRRPGVGMPEDGLARLDALHKQDARSRSVA